MKAYKLLALLIFVLLAAPALGARERSADDYLVRPNDTGYAIAQKHGISLGELSRLNPGVNIGALKAGETIRIGGTPDPAPPAKVEKPTRTTRPAEPEVTVKAEVVTRERTASEDPPKRIEAEKSADGPEKSAATEAKESASKSPAKPEPKEEQGGYLSNYFNEPEKAAKKAAPSVAVSLIRVVGALVFVVALAVLSLYALKHFTSGKVSRKSPRRSINVIETAGLGPNRALHVVQAGNKFLLVGSTPTQINLVAELSTSDAEEVDPRTADDFASILQQSSSAEERADAASQVSDVIRDGAAFLQKKTSATRSMRSKAETDES